MSEREKLIKEFYEVHGLWTPEDYTDFILADRKRIVEPLVKVEELCNKNGYNSLTVELKSINRKLAIDETLKLAGLQKEG